MLSNIKLLYCIPALKQGVFEHFDSTSIENCWVNEKRKTLHIRAMKGDKEFNSWGTSSNEVLAIGVCLMELIERANQSIKPKCWINLKTSEKASHDDLADKFSSLTSFMSTSSGLAAHLSKKHSIENSLSEIIERHVITKSSLCDFGFMKIDDNTFYSLGPLGRYIVVKRHKLFNLGYLYGTSSAKSLNTAIKSAENELAPQVAWSKNAANITHLFDSYSLDDASGIQVYNLMNDIEMKLSQEASVDTHLDVSDFWYSDIELLPEFKEIKNLKITRAFSPILQPFYFGRLLDGAINPLAFEGCSINPSREFNIVA